MRKKVFKRWKRKKIEFDGFCLSYLEGGTKSHHSPILFLHGWSTSTKLYYDCLNCLSQRYWVIAPDLPGFGQSPCFRSLSSYQAYAECLLQFIDHLELNQIQIIGHSFGGGVASAIAASVPHRVSSLIMINSTGIPLTSFSQIVYKRLTQLPRQISQWRLMPFVRIFRALLYNLLFHRKHLIPGTRIALQEDIRPWLNEIQSPCLVLWGGRDYFTPVKLGYALVKAIPDSQWQIVPEGNRQWCMMQPVKLAITVFNFLEAIESQTQINYESITMENSIHPQRDRFFRN